jgi:hypothetical protein
MWMDMYFDYPKNNTSPNEHVLKEQFELGFSKFIIYDVPPTKMIPSSSKKPTITFASHDVKHMQSLWMVLF